MQHALLQTGQYACTWILRLTASSLKARLILGATVHLMHNKGTGVLDEGRAHQRRSPVGSHALRRRLRVALVRHLMMPFGFAPCIMIEKEMRLRVQRHKCARGVAARVVGPVRSFLGCLACEAPQVPSCIRCHAAENFVAQ